MPYAEHPFDRQSSLPVRVMTDSSELREGRITSIRSQSRSHDRVSIYLDGEFVLGIHRDLLLEFNLARGAELDAATVCRIARRDAYFRARAAAFRYLSYRDRAAAEIRRRLERSDYEADVIEDVVHDLEQAGYVDDHAFAQRYAESRFRSGGYGPVRVRSDLKRKGVDADAVDAALEQVFSRRDELLQRAREIGSKRWDRLEREPDALKRKKKVYDYLARRGFGFELVHRVVDELDRDALDR